MYKADTDLSTQTQGCNGASTNTDFNRVNTCAINYVVFLGDAVEFSVS